MLKTRSGLTWIWITILVILIDRITKYVAQLYLIDYVPLPVFPSFNLTLAYNKGAAFSLLNSATGWQTWVFGGLALIVSIGILIWLSRLSVNNKWLCVALTLVMGGALGNLSDRVLYGHVIDFLDLFVGDWHWPTFNVADSAICIGAVMLLIDAVFFQKNKP